MVNGNVQMTSLEDHNVNLNVKKVTNQSTEENENANAKTTKVNSLPVGFCQIPVRLSSLLIKFLSFSDEFRTIFGRILTTSGQNLTRY